MLWRRFSPQRPSVVSAVSDPVILCHERDLLLSLELAAGLVMQRFLILFHRQEEVGPLLLEMPKDLRWV